MNRVIILISLILLPLKNAVYSCTVFMVSNNIQTLVASNEDYKKRNSQVFFVPSKNGRYGYALFGYEGSMQSGVNEKGLFWDGLRAYPYVKVKNNSNKYDIGGNVLHKILEECGSVDEVIKLFQNYYWDGFRVSQLMVADKTGKKQIKRARRNFTELL